MSTWLRSLSLVALMFLLACNHIADYDLWYHLRTGERIPEEGIPQVDDYSFMSAGQPYVDVHWFFQWGIATIYRAGGTAGLVVAKASIAACVVAVALSAVRSLVSFWTLAVAALLMSSRFYERPEIITLLFTAFYLAVLIHATCKPKLLLLLPIVQVIWANVQGLYIFGPILLAMFVMDQWASRAMSLAGRAREEDSPRVPFRLLLVVVLLVAGACFVSPFGIDNVLYVMEIWQKMDPATGGFYRGFIAELQPLREFLAEGGWYLGFTPMIFLVMLIGLMGIFVQRRAIARGELLRVLPVIAFIYLTWQAVRNVSHFALVVGMISAWNLNSTRERWGTNATETPTRRSLFFQLVAPVGACALIAVMFIQGTWQTWMGSNRPFGFGLLPGQYSFEAMELCRREGMPGRALVFHLGHAATYLYVCGPERKVFADARLEVHSEEVIRQYRDLGMAIETGADQRVLDRFGIDVVLASAEHHVGVQASMLCNPYWQCVFWDPIIAVFVRSTFSLPAQVHKVDFRSMIERADSAGDDPHHPRRVESLSRLAQVLAPQPNALPGLVDQVTWAAHFASNDSQAETSTVLAAFWAMRQAHRAGGGMEPSVVDLLFDDWLVENTKRAMTEVADNVTLPLLYQEYLVETGEVEESLDILERLQGMPVRNAAQRKLKNQLHELIVQRREILERKDTIDVPPTLRVEENASDADRRLGEVLQSLLDRDLDRARSLTNSLSGSELSPRGQDWLGRFRSVLSKPSDQPR